MIRALGLVFFLAACPPTSTASSTSSSPPSGDAGADAGRDAGRSCTKECFRAITCRTACGGEITSVGCCQCLPGEVDDIACPRGAATQ